MSVGIRFTLPHDVYPRYGYLQSWTKRLFQRFKEHIESNSLDKCVFSNLGEIKEAEQCLQKPIVTVFAQKRSLVLGLVKALVESLEPFRYEELMSEDVSWNDFIQEGRNDGEYDSKILVVIAQETDQDTLSTLTQTQQENTFIYNPSTRNHKLFVQKGDCLPESKSLSRSLSGDIQSVLERKVVMVLEKMASYILPLIPRVSQEPDKSLLDCITENLKQLDVCCFVEILCKEHTEQQAFIKNKSKSKRKEGFTQSLNSEEMQKLVELVGRRLKCMMIEYLSRMYGIHSMVTTTFLDSDKFLNFEEKFATWISKENICQIGAILKKCETDINIHLIPDVTRFIKQKYELLEIVRIHQFELHGLLRQSDFDVDVVVETKLSPELQDEMLDLKEVTGCGTVYGLLTLHASSELTQLSKNSIKQILQKYNYHKGYKVQLVTFGKHVRPQCETFDKVENGFPLNSECVDNTKCKVGTLGCFVEVKQTSSSVQQKELPKETQTKENIENDGISIVPKRTKPDGVTIQQRLGENQSAEKTISDEQNSCSDNYQDRSQENSGERDSELHCITCAHCVTDCKNVITSDDERPFALQTGFLIEKGYRFDVALLKVCKERRQECSIHEMRILNETRDDVVRYPWRICETLEGLASRPVYKFGSNLPHYTFGVIASDNYKTNSIKGRLMNRYTDPLHDTLDPAVNILVGSEENIQFSRKGDSGSTICDRVIHECIIEGISILHGEIAENKKWLYSYSALLKPTIEKLEEEFSIKIGLPANPFLRNIDELFEKKLEQLTLEEGAVGGEAMEVTKGNDNRQEEHFKRMM